MANYYIKGKNPIPDYWNYCIKNDIPMVELIPGRKYSKVNYDIYSMLGRALSCDGLLDEVNALYAAYAKFFSLPKERYAAIGGSSALIITVFAEHGEFIAEHMFNFLLRYVRTNRSLPGSEEANIEK